MSPIRAYAQSSDEEEIADLGGVAAPLVAVQLPDGPAGSQTSGVTSTGPCAAAPLTEILTVMTPPVTFTRTQDDGVAVVDFPLAQPVSLTEVRIVVVEALRVDFLLISDFGRGFGGYDVCSIVRLTSGGVDVLEVERERNFTNIDVEFRNVFRFSRVLTPELLASLPTTQIDGIRLVFEIDVTNDIFGNRLQITGKSIHEDDKLRAYFIPCDFAPCGPHVQRKLEGLPSLRVTANGPSAWQTFDFAEPVTTVDLRIVTSPRFSWVGRFFNRVFFFATSELQLLLSDGSTLTMDDWQSPSTLGTPEVAASSRVFLRLSDEVQATLEGRALTGFRWRIHAANMSSFVEYTPFDPFVFSFLYDSDDCRGTGSALIDNIVPENGTDFAVGSTIAISGRSVGSDPASTVSAIQVNNEPVDSLDFAGRFFKLVQIEAGVNVVEITAINSCGQFEAVIEIIGTEEAGGGVDELADVSAQLDDEYAGTTFNRAANTLVVQGRARDVGATPVDGPVLMAIGPQLNPAVDVVNPDGRTLENEPFFGLVEGGTSLDPGEAGTEATLLFANVERVKIEYDVRWLALGNRAPVFSTVPIVTTDASSHYIYPARATDPDGHTVVFALDAAPADMTIDMETGDVEWQPIAADIGAHDVAVAACDSRGGRTVQRYALLVVEVTANRPPIFTSAPVTQTSVGAAYSYDAAAVDFDGDSLLFSLTSAPPDTTIDEASGLMTWPFAQQGQFIFGVRVEDGNGGEARQSFLLTVGDVAANPSIPLFTGVSPTLAVVGLPFIYQPVVDETDDDDLMFTLDLAPDGMTIDESTGRIQWTPSASQLGAHNIIVVVTDGRGGFAQQVFSLDVLLEAPNFPPVFETTPPTFAVVDQLYVYEAVASDPEANVVTYSLAIGPAGMTVNPADGAVAWTPTADASEMETVVLEAADPAGNKGQQAFRINVRLSNAAPQFVSAPVDTAVAGASYNYGAVATDADGDIVSYELVSGPAGLGINSFNGIVFWSPTAADLGLHAVTIAATDCCGGFDEQSYDLTVTPDDVEPTVSLFVTREPACINEPFQACVRASDNVGIAEREVRTVEGSQPLDALDCATLEFMVPQVVKICGVATDVNGNVGVATKELQVVDCLDPEAPTVELVSPTHFATIIAPVDIIATINDNTPAVLSWEVRIAREGSDDFKTIGQGTGPVTEGVVAMLDPTLLQNDTYRVQVIANDGVQAAGVQAQYNIAGDLKLGQFTISFTDLTIPVAGIPLVITRQYNSLDTTQGDFGAGWRLGLAGQVSDSAIESMVDDGGLIDLFLTQPLLQSPRIYVTRPDGRRVGFTFEAIVLPFGAGAIPIFTPDLGVTDTLKAIDPLITTLSFEPFLSETEVFPLWLVPFNPDIYELTTKEGITYTIHEFDGLQKVEDSSGNTITVTPDGITSSTGVSLTFERDAQGRITKIIEPDDPADPDPPGELHYVYDLAGNLVKFIDQIGHETEYFYENVDSPHHLTRLVDPLDRPLTRTVFDDDGRMIAVCDANGDLVTLDGCVAFAHDATTLQRTGTDASGNVIISSFDVRGNVLQEILVRPGQPPLITGRTYDDQNRILTETDPLGTQTDRFYAASSFSRRRMTARS